jgi:cell division protein FtsI (penicillin-binding protein 3)
MYNLSQLCCLRINQIFYTFAFGLVLSLNFSFIHAETLSDRSAKDPTSIAVYDRHGIKVDPTNFEQLDFLKANDFKNSKLINLTLDIQVNKILDEEIQEGIQKYKAIGAGGILIDAQSGEIIAISSKYTDQRNLQFNAEGDARFNMITEGVYEIGSTAKVLTILNAVENKLANAETKIDARKPLHIGKYEIGDYHATNRILSLDEAFLHSSNIAISKLALKVGSDAQSDFMKKIGFDKKSTMQFMEMAEPILPKSQSKLITATTGFGHGFAVTPLHAVVAMSAFVNGGHTVEPSIVKQDRKEPSSQSNIIRTETSAYARHLLALNVEKGSGTKAKVEGISIGGSTSTAEKALNGQYVKDKLFSTFITAFPIDKPRYVLMTLFDEPQGLPETYGFATAGWNAAVVAGNAIKRLVPVLKLD